MGVGTAFGKLILFGEHAAVYGHPAVGISLPFHTSVTIDPGTHHGWRTEASRSGRKDIAASLVREAFGFVDPANHGRLYPGGTVRIESDIPQGAGFGSSAALCGAIAAAAASTAAARPSHWQMEGFAKVNTSADAAAQAAGPGEIWQRAHRMERHFHGTPSGIDTGLAIIGGLLSFKTRPPDLPDVERLRSAALFLVVGTTPRAGDTSSLVGGIRQRCLAGDEQTEGAIRSLGQIAQSAILELQQASAGEGKSAGELCRRLGALADQAQATLETLGLGSPAHRTLIDEGRRLGAAGGKLSGAGGGGAFFLLFPDDAGAGRTALLLTEFAAESAPEATILGAFRLGDDGLTRI